MRILVTLLVLVAPAGLAVGSGTGLAQTVDTGVFDLYAGGVRVGEERFTIREERSAGGRVFRSGSELNLKLDGQTARVRVAVEVSASTLRPLRYEAEFDGSEAMQIRGVVTRDRFRLIVRSPRGERIQQFLPGRSWAILEERVAHLYYFVARLLTDSEEREITAIVPHDRREITLRLEDRGRATTRVSGRQLELRHLVIQGPGDSQRHVWLDDEGRLMKVEIPDAGWSAQRSDPPEP